MLLRCPSEFGTLDLSEFGRATPSFPLWRHPVCDHVLPQELSVCRRRIFMRLQ
jgi:hypothetical protein